MKLKLSDNPKEWRKTAWLTAVGLSVFTGLLRWRGVLPLTACIVLWVAFAVSVVGAGIEPAWFRGFYNFSMRLGFAISQIVGKIILAAFFVVIITPMGIVRRALGKDPLRLRRHVVESYWTRPRGNTPLDRLF